MRTYERYIDIIGKVFTSQHSTFKSISTNIDKYDRKRLTKAQEASEEAEEAVLQNDVSTDATET